VRQGRWPPSRRCASQPPAGAGGPPRVLRVEAHGRLTRLPSRLALCAPLRLALAAPRHLPGAETVRVQAQAVRAGLTQAARMAERRRVRTSRGPCIPRLKTRGCMAALL
jgi:hypothetical protein